MALGADTVSETEKETSAPEDEMGRGVVAARERFEGCFPVGSELETRGLSIDSLSACELSELEETISERLALVFDEVVERWQDDHAERSEHERIDRELRRRITSEKASIVDLHRDWECDGCGTQHHEYYAFEEYHGLLLCDGCAGAARDELRAIQRPLIDRLRAEPTLAHAGPLGFELTRRDDGRLVWLGDDDYLDGGSHPYANEQEALHNLIEELR